MSILTTNMSRHLTPLTSTANNRVSSDARPTKSAAQARKSSPLPDPDDWKARVTTTTTNTSTNSATNPSHAFVFASSRTVRSLHSRPNTYDDIGSLLAAGLADSIPLGQTRSSSSSTSSSTRPRRSKNPSLSSAQLARHSSGATDARFIVSPSMRAAGFVPLYNNRQPDRALPPPCLAASDVPTPMYPPCFPPLVFVSYASAGTPPAWVYQESPFFGPHCETQTVAMAEALDLEKAIVQGMAAQEQSRSGRRTEGVPRDGGIVTGGDKGQRHRCGCECEETSEIAEDARSSRVAPPSLKSASPFLPASARPSSRCRDEGCANHEPKNRSHQRKEKVLGGLHLPTFPNPFASLSSSPSTESTTQSTPQVPGSLKPSLSRLHTSGPLLEDGDLSRRRIPREHAFMKHEVSRTPLLDKLPLLLT